MSTGLFILIIVAIIFFVNTFAAFVTVFWSRREVPIIWAWLLALTLIPVIGFVFYWFAGRRISDKKIFSVSSQEENNFEKKIPMDSLPIVDKSDAALELLKLFETTEQAPVLSANDVQIFTDGPNFFDELFDSISKAKESIHIEFFTINNDSLGKKLIDLLVKKAKENVEVRVVFDQFGSHGKNLSLYKKLVDSGGTAVPFLMRRFQILTLRFNFRLHRKLAIIDGRISFIGGYNVGDKYVDLDKKIGHWRDTHLKIEGNASWGIQSRFIKDWNATAKKNEKILRTRKYFPEIKPTNKHKKIPMQIVSSGPDNDLQKIKQGYLRMISLAKHSIDIQTPYFVPDQPILEALQIAAASGVKVRLMIPNQPDHPLVYRATEYYASELMDAGIEVYKYQAGFLHSKLIVVDQEIASVGSANFDVRSFSLNFEANTFIYDKKFSRKIVQLFDDDTKEASLLKKDYFVKQSYWLKFKQRFSRLLSPVL